MKGSLQRAALLLNRAGAGAPLLWFYRLAFKTAKALLENRHLRVWPRNSFCFGIVNPGISDIDLTFFFDRDAPEGLPGQSLDRLASLRRLLPVLGEANLYRSDEIGLYREAGNYFELRRDPELFARLKRSWTNERIAGDAAVFVLRALWSDYDYLKLFPELRRHKWGYIFRALNDELNTALAPGNLSPEAVVENLVLLAPFLERDVAFLSDIFDRRKDDAFALPYLRLYPHYWLGDYHDHPKFDEYLSSLARLGPEARGVVKSQIAWEIWGIYSQMHALSSDEGLHYHFLNLRKVLECLQYGDGALLDDIATAEGMLKSR